MVVTELPNALLAKALRALEAAVALEHEDTATNRDACFYVARATLMGKPPKTHSGVHNRFALRFVASGRVPVEVARRLPHVAQVREKADYDAFAVTDLLAAANLVADAGRFVEAVRSVVEK